MPRTQKPVSPAQLSANRANATHSAGPKSPDGKTRSSQNSFKHGFTASSFAVVRLEDLQEIARLESGIFTTCLNETLDTNEHPFTPMSQELAGDIEITRAQNRNYCLADGFLRIVRQSNGLSLFLRYQAQAERQYRRALEDFDRLKAPQPFLPSEPIPDLQPQPEPATYPASDTDPFPSEYVPSAPDPPPAAVTSPLPAVPPSTPARSARYR
jgi:hypothetical protein